MLEKTPPQKMKEAIQDTHLGAAPMTSAVAVKVLPLSSISVVTPVDYSVERCRMFN
jgi:hypothetical protein